MAEDVDQTMREDSGKADSSSGKKTTSLRLSDEERRMLTAVMRHERLENESQTVRRLIRDAYSRLPSEGREEVP